MSETPAKKARLEVSKESKSTKHENANREICQMLLELADYEKNVNGQVYKYNAYRRAAKSLSELATKIKSGKDARKLKGVGDHIAQKIDEYLTSGKIEALEKTKNNEESLVVKELIRVSGIGPSAARRMFKEGVKTIDDLKKIKVKLNHQQKIGLKYLEDFEKRIPRDEMIKLKDILIKEIESLDKQYKVTICGSFRRGAETSGDIDVLITHPNYVSDSYVAENKITSRELLKELIIHSKRSPKPLLDKIVKRLYQLSFLTDTISFGDTKYMGVCQLDKSSLSRRIDLRLFPSDQYYCAVLYFTGSNEFNKNMRKLALEKGYTLNEYSLRKLESTGVGHALNISSEKDIFRHLDMEYKSPEERND